MTPSAEDTSSGLEEGQPAGPSRPASVQSSLTQALRDLARGEQAASALEANLASLESKLDELLASFEETERTSNGPAPAVEEVSEDNKDQPRQKAEEAKDEKS